MVIHHFCRKGIYICEHDFLIVLSTDHPLTLNSEVIIRIIPESISFGSKDVLDALRYALRSIRMSFIELEDSKAFMLGFDTFDSFRYFHEKVLFHGPVEQNLTSKPFIVKISFMKTPTNKQMKDILNISMEPYRAMGITIIELPETGSYEIYFPNEEAYFINFMKVFMHCDYMNQKSKINKNKKNFKK